MVETIFDRIENASEREIREIMDAVQERLAVVNPAWDIVYLAVPKQDLIQRQETLQQAFRMLREDEGNE